MATYGKKLLDANGNVILPKTRSVLVYMTDNSTVEEAIKRLKDRDTELSELVPEKILDFTKTQTKTDLENLAPGIYSISCNSNGKVNFNLPSDEFYGIIVQAQSSVPSNGTTGDLSWRQYLFGSYDNNYYRTKNDNEAQYGEWKIIKNNESIKALTANISNWNNIAETGMSVIAASGDTWTNMWGSPSGAPGYGILLSFKVTSINPYYAAQIYMCDKGGETEVYARVWAGSWKKWIKVTGSSVGPK